MALLMAALLAEAYESQAASTEQHICIQVRLRGSVSSQYLTALLMAAPLAEGQGSVDIVISDELVSKPYVAMTVGLMAVFGVEVRSRGPTDSGSLEARCRSARMSTNVTKLD